MTRADCKTFEYFGKIFVDDRQRLETILRRYEVPPHEASGLLEETVLELIYKGGSAEAPTVWLESRLTHKCRRYWVARRRLFARAVARVFPVPSADHGTRATHRGDEDAQNPPR
jgi:hypothetical protein